jgi:hypothetical protein
MAGALGIVPLLEASSLDTLLGLQHGRSAVYDNLNWDRQLRHTVSMKGVVRLASRRPPPCGGSWVAFCCRSAACSVSRQLVLHGNDQCGVGQRRDDDTCGSDCRMDLPGPTTSVGTRTDYSVGLWDYPACATRHLKAWSTRTTQE